MLFSKARQNRGTLGKIAWDEKTIETVAKSNQFNVRITEFNCTSQFGVSRQETLTQHSLDGEFRYEIHGILTEPKFAVVSISFFQSSSYNGVWSYDVLDRHEFRGEEVCIPKIDFHIADLDGRANKVIHDAHRDAILCGRAYSNIRVFKRIGDGLMTDADKEHGYSYESTYPILGWVTWSDLYSDKLPGWAYEPSDTRFTLDSIPERYNLDRELNACQDFRRRR